MSQPLDDVLADLLNEFDREFGCEGFCLKSDGKIIYFNDHWLEEADEDLYGEVRDFITKAYRIGQQETLESLTDEERVEIFNKYCKHCGSKNPSCKCWNDS